MPNPICRRWLREPLVHFIVLGSAVFAMYAMMKDHRPGPLTEKDAPVEQLVRDWQARTGTLPSAEQRDRLVRQWLEEEALYRRALELGLDRTDTVVRRRLVQRMRFLVEDTTPVPEPDETDLRAWVTEHADQYAEPARLSFEHRFFSRGKRGIDVARDAEAAAAALRESPETPVRGDPFPRGERFVDQKPASIARSFGKHFADRLMELPVGSWSGPIESSYGLHVARVTERHARTPSSLDAIRARVRADWIYAERQRRNEQAVDRLVTRYATEGQAVR
ncbi:MAG: peptidylprolyl isomerase [Myxococcales bacterium]